MIYDILESFLNSEENVFKARTSKSTGIMSLINNLWWIDIIESHCCFNCQTPNHQDVQVFLYFVDSAFIILHLPIYVLYVLLGHLSFLTSFVCNLYNLYNTQKQPYLCFYVSSNFHHINC